MSDTNTFDLATELQWLRNFAWASDDTTTEARIREIADAIEKHCLGRVVWAKATNEALAELPESAWLVIPHDAQTDGYFTAQRIAADIYHGEGGEILDWCDGYTDHYAIIEAPDEEQTQ